MPGTSFSAVVDRSMNDDITKERVHMSKESDNKAIVGRWFTDFWGKTCNLAVVDQIAAPSMLLQYSLHEPREAEMTSRPS